MGREESDCKACDILTSGCRLHMRLTPSVFVTSHSLSSLLKHAFFGYLEAYGT